jgi:hypothetical protein
MDALGTNTYESANHSDWDKTIQMTPQSGYAHLLLNSTPAEPVQAKALEIPLTSYK